MFLAALAALEGLLRFWISSYALRVLPAGTWLTVHRRRRVRGQRQASFRRHREFTFWLNSLLKLTWLEIEPFIFAETIFLLLFGLLRIEWCKLEVRRWP